MQSLFAKFSDRREVCSLSISSEHRLGTCTPSAAFSPPLRAPTPSREKCAFATPTESLCSEALELRRGLRSFRIPCAGVAELADALDSKSSDRKIVWVRAPPPAQFVGVGWLNAARSMAGSASLFACSRQTTRDASTSLGMTTSLDRVGTSPTDSLHSRLHPVCGQI